MKKYLLIILSLFTLLFNTTVYSKEIEEIEVYLKNEFSGDISSKSAILIEPSTKTILFEKESTMKLPPASMTKIMTMILVCDELKANNIKLTDEFITSKYAESMGGTQIYLEENEKMSVEDLLKSVAIASANDAAVVLAEGISGSCEKFVERMNNKGKELGFKNSNFVNPNGLPENNHYSCAYDMALAGCYLINNHSDIILKYTSLYEDYVREGTDKKFWLVNTNKLIRIDGIDGLKTGRTDEAGYCITCTMNKNNVRMISVVMGCESIDNRNSDTLSLLNYGVNNFELSKIYSQGDVISQNKNILFRPKNFNFVIEKDIYILKNRNCEIDNIKEEIVIYNKEYNELEVGIINIYIDDILIDSSKIILQKPVKKANIFMLLVDFIEMIFYI